MFAALMFVHQQQQVGQEFVQGFPGIAGALRSRARLRTAPLGTARPGPGAGATWWPLRALQSDWETGLCETAEIS